MIALPPITIPTAVSVIERNVTYVGRCWHLNRSSVACKVREDYVGTATDNGSQCTFRFRYIARATRRPDGSVVVTELTHPPDAECTFN